MGLKIRTKGKNASSFTYLLLHCLQQGVYLAGAICILFLAGSPAPAQAQAPTIRFERISLEHGISHGTVFSVVQDKTGYMWFGTQSGLNRYDGYNITVFKHDPDNPDSISNDNAGNLYADRSGTVWIGTWGGGLDKFDSETGRFIHYLNDPADPTSLSNDRVQTIYQDRAGTLWVGTAEGGLNRFNAGPETFTHYRHNPDDPTSLSNDRIWRIVEDSSGLLWIATSDGLNKFDPATETFTHYKNDPNDPNSLTHDLVRTLYYDKFGFLWIGTEAGLDRFDPIPGIFVHYKHDPADPNSLSDDTINAIYEDSAGNFWVGTSRGGLNKFDRSSQTFTHYLNDPLNAHSLSYNDVRWIQEDRSGVLWVATRGGGVNKFVPGSEQFTYLGNNPNDPNSLNNNDVRAIYQDPEKVLWIGTKGGGLNKLDPSAGTVTIYQNDPNDPNSLTTDDVYVIHSDAAGLLWLGLAGGGLVKFDPRTETFTRYQHDPDDPTTISNDDVNSVYEDPSGLLWIGTKGGGLNKFNPVTEEFSHYENDPADPGSLGGNDVYEIYQDEAGLFWIATYGGGLNRFDPPTGRFVRYQNNPDDPTSLNSDDLYTIYKDPEGIFWVGTASGGLNRFDPHTGTFTHFTEAEGLLGDVVYGILPDAQGNLWLSTSKGISKFDPRTHNFVNYNPSTGLESTGYHEGAYFKNSAGEIFFGGINGLIRFDPEDIKDNSIPPTVVLTDFRLPNNRTINLGMPLDHLAEVKLSYQENVFTFEFAALDYNNPAKNQYAYQLEGFDEDWIQASTRRFATYTNLDPGLYTFRVRGANSTGVWNEQGTAIKIIITPPFWETWWFRTVAVLAIVGLVVTGYKLRVRSLHLQRQRLKMLVDERTAELSEANQHLRTLTGRLREELALAKEIQEGLLPPPRPNWPELDVLCYSTSAYEVGGDFFAYHDFNGRPAQHFAIAVGDVSGKGMPAALLMAVSLASFQSAIGRALPPGTLLASLDEAILPYTRTRLQNCAMCYAEFNSKTLRVANAGCVSPVIRRSDGRIEWVEIGGTPLGIGLGAQDGYHETTLDLHRGDLVIMISDGVIEAMTPSREMFGFDRLEQAITAGPQTSAEAMLNHLRQEVWSFIGEAELRDDVTIVVVQV